MGTHLSPDGYADEDYISMELISSPRKSLPQIKEFEFQYFSTSTHNPADDLFYKGKLLPLHLPPRRQMVEHLLRTAPCTNSNTPLHSCNISPSQSCRVSCDLNHNDTLFEWPSQFTTFFNNHPTNYSWPRKLKIKLLKHSHKLKSSRAFLKSLFTKSACSDQSSKIIKKLIKKTGIDDDDNSHRRSFSGAITAKCSSNSSSSSSSSSFNWSGVHEMQFLRRSSSAAEIELSIDAAIAHCKKSMQTFGINCSLSSPKYV